MDIDLGPYSSYLALVAVLVGVFTYKNYKHTKAKCFFYFIVYALVSDYIGSHILYQKLGFKTTYWHYNIYTLVVFVFYLWWFRSLLTNELRKKIVIVFIPIFIIVFLIEALIMQELFLYRGINYSFCIGVIFLAITICYYFIEIFNSEAVLKLRSSMYFWFGIGALLFHVAYLPFFVSIQFFAYDVESVVPLGLAIFILNVFMNVCFIIGFLNAKHSNNQHKIPLK